VHAGGLFAAVLDARVDTPHDYSREMPIEPWAAIHRHPRLIGGVQGRP